MPANAGFSPIQVSIPAEGGKIDLTPFLTEVENQPFNEVLNKLGCCLWSSTAFQHYYEVGQTYNTDIFALKGEKTTIDKPFFSPPFFKRLPTTLTPLHLQALMWWPQRTNTVEDIHTFSGFGGAPGWHPLSNFFGSGGRSTYWPVHRAQLPKPVGTAVTANKPIALTMHDDSTNSGSFGQCSDLMGDQILPDDLLGTEHIVVVGTCLHMTVFKFSPQKTTPPSRWTVVLWPHYKKAKPMSTFWLHLPHSFNRHHLWPFGKQQGCDVNLGSLVAACGMHRFQIGCVCSLHK